MNFVNVSCVFLSEQEYECFGNSITIFHFCTVFCCSIWQSQFLIRADHQYRLKHKRAFFWQVAKYPHIEDYRKAVRELDEKEYLSMWLVMCEIRNRYCTLHDIVMKNIEKLKKPRSCNTQSLYWTSSSFPFRDVPFRD